MSARGALLGWNGISAMKDDAAIRWQKIHARHAALEEALRNLIAAMEDNASATGICDWSEGEHKAIEQARDILDVPSDS
jgi:hypothetical protein